MSLKFFKVRVMSKIFDYLDFIRLKGKPLADINPGSDEFALKVNDAFHAIELLKDSQLPILGGDVLTDNSGALVYAYQSWGSEYIYLNWYCDKMENESQTEYCERSYDVARNCIGIAHEASKKIGRDCYVVLVV